MPTFENRLRNLEVRSEIITSGGCIDIEQLLASATIIREKHPQLKSQKVIVVFTDTATFTTALLAFDGFCGDLYLCSVDASKSLPSDIYRWPTNEISESQTKVSNAVLLNAESPNIKESPEERGNTRWHLASSGTSGQPKWFSHQFVDLTRHAKTSAKLQGLCWANLYEPHRFAGLQVLLQALLSGAKLVDIDEQNIIAKVKQYSHHKVSAISATASMWRQLFMTNQLPTLPLTHITLGGEIADQSILERLSETFPVANIRHIYASTEAGVGFVVSDNKAGFPVAWLKEGINGALLAIDNNQHLRIKPQVELDKNLINRIDGNGFLDTEDKVELVGDRVLFLGRASGMINVGGNKVYPEKVEAILMLVKGVEQVKVYSKSNSVVGALVVADVVKNNTIDWNIVVKNIRQQCKLKLQRFEIPVKLHQVDRIEVNPSGKLSRRSTNG